MEVNVAIPAAVTPHVRFVRRRHVVVVVLDRVLSHAHVRGLHVTDHCVHVLVIAINLDVGHLRVVRQEAARVRVSTSVRHVRPIPRHEVKMVPVFVHRAHILGRLGDVGDKQIRQALSVVHRAVHPVPPAAQLIDREVDLHRVLARRLVESGAEEALVRAVDVASRKLVNVARVWVVDEQRVHLDVVDRVGVVAREEGRLAALHVLHEEREVGRVERGQQHHEPVPLVIRVGRAAEVAVEVIPVTDPVLGAEVASRGQPTSELVEGERAVQRRHGCAFGTARLSIHARSLVHTVRIRGTRAVLGTILPELRRRLIEADRTREPLTVFLRLQRGKSALEQA
mmetsp:Transcript_55919/g.154152  ORF Transcript_55919/g.154152 Transcript_55919/m.154152 type:complete len:340 (-) Transcript_55919:353-1372(-)